jgi:chloramphenicol 3-O-phosphotransferase
MMTHRIPFNYEADATAPRWNRFMREIMCGDEEMVDYLQRLFGYAATGHTKESIVVVFHGGGANGKSVLLNAIRHVLATHLWHCGILNIREEDRKSSTADLASVVECTTRLRSRR